MFDCSFVTTKCLIKKEGKILLLKEGPSEGEVENFHTGTYGLPGGRLDEGERLMDGVIREMKEETGRSVNVGEIVHCSDFVFEFRDQQRHGIMLVFEAEFTDDIEVCLSDEHTAYGWFTKQELDTIQIIPNQIEILKKLS